MGHVSPLDCDRDELFDEAFRIQLLICLTRFVYDWHTGQTEVGAFYWTVLTPDIVNLGREEQGSVSV